MQRPSKAHLGRRLAPACVTMAGVGLITWLEDVQMLGIYGTLPPSNGVGLWSSEKKADGCRLFCASCPSGRAVNHFAAVVRAKRLRNFSTRPPMVSTLF